MAFKRVPLCLKKNLNDSHIQRIVLATEETTVTQQVSHRPIKCQSRLWSHKFRFFFKQQHCDNPLVPSRARSLRNLLVSGNECGRVFPAGVGPGSPSRDAANWLPSRFSLSVETRRRYGWLRMMVFPGARLFPSPNLVPFGRVAARERQGALSRRAW